MKSELQEVVDLLSDEGKIRREAMPSECFSLCNLMKQFEACNTEEEHFYLGKLESALLTFCGRLRSKKALIGWAAEIEELLTSEFSMETSRKVQSILERMEREVYADELLKPITVKLLQ